MKNDNIKMFKNIEPKTRLYLVIIAITLILLCINVTTYIIPSIVIYFAIILYTVCVHNKRNSEISNYINELTISMDSAAKNTLINSPFPLIIVETDGNVIWRSNK